MEEVVLEKKIGYLDILKDKNYCLFMIGNLISRFGDSIDTIAYGWLVYEITGSTSLMALLFGVNAVPTIIFQPIAGVLVDYKNKKKVMVICNLGRAVVVTVTAVLFILGLLRSYHLFIFTFINSSFEAFESPAGVAAMPLIIDKEKFAYAKSVQGTLSRIIELFGLAAAAGIIAVLGIGGAMLINAASFYLCAIFTWFVKFKKECLKKAAINIMVYLKDLKEGFYYVKGTKVIFTIMIFAALINILLLPFNTLSVAYVNEELLKGPEVLAILSFTITSGMLLGGAIYPKIEEKIKKNVLFIASGVVLGLAYLSLALLPIVKDSVVLYVGLVPITFIFGVSASIFLMLINLTFMRKTQQEYLGRAAGILNSLCMAATPVGSCVIAGLCIFLSVSQLFLFFGILMVIIFFVQRFNSVLKEI